MSYNFNSKNSLKNSSKGDPGGTWGRCEECDSGIDWVVETFTTAGFNFSAKLAKLSGADLAWTETLRQVIINAIKKLT